MWGFFILLLLIYAVRYWYLLLAAVAVCTLGWWLADYWHRYEAERADHLRHERARREIAAIELATSSAMHQAARGERQVVDGTSVEVTTDERS